MKTEIMPKPEAGQPLAPTACSAAFVECTEDCDRDDGGERWIRRIDQKCWISVLHRRTGFGWMEWETALVFVIEPVRSDGESDDRDVLIIAGDRRAELATLPKEQLRDWYAVNINGNRNSMDTMIHALKQQKSKLTHEN